MSDALIRCLTHKAHIRASNVTPQIWAEMARRFMDGHDGDECRVERDDRAAPPDDTKGERPCLTTA